MRSWAARFRGVRDVKLDLSQEVTGFVTTVGAPTFEQCCQHLDRQDCRFRREVIDHVAPMSAAFQRMLDDCRTPYFVQVDEDMLLHPEAIRTLHATIAAEPAEVVMYAADLFDPHLERCIVGVKIFRHEIARRYPFAPVDAFEVDQLARMEADGFCWRKATAGRTPVPGQTLGVHEIGSEPERIYERYRRLALRAAERPGGMRWFQEIPGELLQRFLDDPSEANYLAVQGLIAGTLRADGRVQPARDHRQYGRAEEMARLHEIFANLTDPARNEGSGEKSTRTRLRS